MRAELKTDEILLHIAAQPYFAEGSPAMELLEGMIDREGKEYQRQQLQYQRFDIEAVLKRNPKLLKTPIVRDGKRATVGYEPEVWKQWIQT